MGAVCRKQKHLVLIKFVISNWINFEWILKIYQSCKKCKKIWQSVHKQKNLEIPRFLYATAANIYWEKHYAWSLPWSNTT